MRSFFGSILIFAAAVASARAEDLPRIRVAPDGRGFVETSTGKPFVPLGFNYDHDERGRLIEDYWDAEWPKIEEDFREMKALGANLVRAHLQLGRFMASPERANDAALARLGKLVEVAQRTGLYLDLTGLACYHRADVPAWYDPLSERQRWEVQARFWEAIAARCAGQPAVFCYDLMNEPVVAVRGSKNRDWLGPAFAGKHFVQCVSLDPQERTREEVARAWIARLVTAIRARDRDALVTVGLVDWSLDKPNKLYSGFAPDKVAGELDFLCVHIYPERGKVPDALGVLREFAAVGKPVVIEETFPLKCGIAEFDTFARTARESSAGLIGFYWGQTPEEARRSTKLQDKLVLAWLEWFQSQRPAATSPTGREPE